MVKQTAKQLVRHCVGGFIALMPNFAVYALLRILGIAPGYQTVISFLAAGQIAFVVHTFWSYKDRAERRTKWGYLRQYCVFMVGQAAAGRLNFYVAEEARWVPQVQEKFNHAAQCLLQWLFRAEYDYWTFFMMPFLLPLAAGVMISFPWTNFVSHRKKKS